MVSGRMPPLLLLLLLLLLFLSRGGDTKDEGGENSWSASATRDWKYTRIVVLGNLKEQLQQNITLKSTFSSFYNISKNSIKGVHVHMKSPL